MQFPGKSSRAAFTLIELLMVIAVIAILGAITLGVSNGVREAQNRAKAQAELAVLGQALEQFKTVHGDYPWTDGDPSGDSGIDANAANLFEALVGWSEFTGSGASAELRTKTSVPAGGPEPLVDVSKLTYVELDTLEEGVPEAYNPELELSTAAPDNVGFIDPWGKPYVYFYGKGPRGSNSWEYFGYHLYSLGPDGEQDTSSLSISTGILNSDFRDAGSGENLDNLYHQE